MGWLGSGLTFPVSCLILVWAAGSGSVQVRDGPTCFSDYLSTSTCEWRMGGPTDCSAELRLTYQLDFPNSENHTCVPVNGESAVCLCDMLMDIIVSGDTYQLDLWAGKQWLWSGSFRPSEHVKPRAPGNLTVNATDSHTWQLSWSDPYPPESILHSELFYLVNISNEDDPTEFLVSNVTYREHTLHIPASTLKPGALYSARVRAWAPSYNSLWSEWSPRVQWLNDYEWPWEQHLPLAVGISCIIIMVVCLSCYFSILKIKKEWWDHIPSPAHSSLVALVIQEPQVPLRGKRSGGQEPAKCPYWKTCLTKLLPCLLEPGVERGDGSSQAARSGPVQGPGKPAWRPVEVSSMVLWPESISVVKCVELLEAPVQSEEEEPVEEDGGSFCPSPESSGGSFQEGRAGIAARLTESLLLDLLGGAEGGFCPPGSGEPCLLPPSAGVSAQMPWAELPGEAPQEASLRGSGQPSDPEPPPATRTQSPACPAVAELPAATITDNPAYRSFSSLLCPPSDPGELDSDPQLAEHQEDGDLNVLYAPQASEPPVALQPEPETWEQGLRWSVLQHRAAAPASAPGGYRQFAQAVRQGCAQGSEAGGPSGEAGYKALSSLLASGAVCPTPPGVEASSGEGGYRPFQGLTPGSPGVPTPVPLFTFGLDMGPPPSPQNSLLPSGSPECPGLEPVAPGEDSQKRPLALEQAMAPLGDDLGSGIVYSALTCHLCGHLKQCHGQEERGEAHGVAPRCCGCRCGGSSEPLGSPLPGGVLLEASLPPASLAPLGVSEKGKDPLFFQPGPSHAQSSSQTPQMVAMLSTGPTGMSAS
ncbi:interleukin-4 receptor subunit alpha isoform X1 [Myotis lucifugus]|uniref:Interleukin-4 receptor subunit alpha n=2 Tax=Myotis lucifugus TaxID=59463 RepID=G1PJ12_MYOLU|nr:interleukin-4 receptor subunit alpha isoform X1 [Myotis lucifugus]XP_014302658.1 interleukin-4 receptor subunit alpha isoform X1 [Myotis lucifugus]XP_023601826.1 interleukin-4 receptor subunit alpha isoform X1 [Myotis lucifugus]XP_023601828.1 interleukin-4 receptor subunit alpha isoform X1 [Myotis lucifugus]XP_023601829.1 interleukin-4 receptor subunit alpha isoform X1 [Myotis lucifugus]XP_023601830.1 interleukin-4 receptor subunit alpha isoform X1 [Myotis lucifugus]